MNDISFRIQAGQITGLIGPNGAGKSTTFNLITGVLGLTSGEVRFRGENIAGIADVEAGAIPGEAGEFSNVGPENFRAVESRVVVNRVLNLVPLI